MHSLQKTPQIHSFDFVNDDCTGNYLNCRKSQEENQRLRQEIDRLQDKVYELERKQSVTQENQSELINNESQSLLGILQTNYLKWQCYKIFLHLFISLKAIWGPHKQVEMGSLKNMFS